MRLPFALAKRFVAGREFVEAVPKVQHLNDKNIKVTLDLLGENVSDREQASDTTRHYIELLDGIAEMGLTSSISIKLTMMGLDIDESFCRDNLFALLEKAREHNQFVRIDMEGSAYTQLTVDMYKQAQQEFGKHVGIVIQAYLHRTKDDINDIASLGGDVRICKGAYN